MTVQSMSGIAKSLADATLAVISANRILAGQVSGSRRVL